jgi:hypothetical protein
MEWFKAGGFGMLLIALFGILSLVFAGRALASPSDGRLRSVRLTPALMIGLALFSFGTNMWAVYRHVSKGAEEGIAMIGVLEAAQPLTFGGLFAALLTGLVIAAESRKTA